MGVLYFSAAVLLCTVGVVLSYPYREDMMRGNYYVPPSFSRQSEVEVQEIMNDDSYLGSPYLPESETEAQETMEDNRHSVGFPYFPEEEAEVQSRLLQTGTPYRLLHHHCDDRESLNPPIRYFLKMPQSGDDRWGIDTCNSRSCQSTTTIHFSSSTNGGTIRSGDSVMVVASNDVILMCDSSKCPKQFSRYEFTIYKCCGRVGDAIQQEEIVMLYTTHNGLQCQVSFNRANPYLWCPGTPLHTPPKSNECYDSCGTGVFVMPT